MDIDTKMINEIINQHIKVATNLISHSKTIESICNISLDALKNNKKVIFCGNGGSASDSIHIVAELVGRFEKDRIGLPALALSSNTANITAIANDYGFEKIFSRQVESLGEKDDVLFCLSTSGNSINILNAIDRAEKMGIHCIGLTGNDGGKLKTYNKCKELLIVDSSSTARIQEMHILIGHILCSFIEQNLS
jgi:D-sedoheptulose 7-phosphate isomerase